MIISKEKLQLCIVKLPINEQCLKTQSQLMNNFQQFLVELSNQKLQIPRNKSFQLVISSLKLSIEKE